MPPRKSRAAQKKEPQPEPEPSTADERQEEPTATATSNQLSLENALKAELFADDGSHTAEECMVVLREKIRRLQALETESVQLRTQAQQYVIANAYLTQKDVQFQDEFERLRSLTEPGLLQLKQLITEPAVNREFMRLASLAKSSSLEAQRLKDEIRGLHFGTNNPKGASSLLSQIKGLEGKVRALSAEGMESKVTALEASLKLAEAKVSELTRKVYSLEDKNRALLVDKDALEKELLGYRHPRDVADGGGGGVGGGSRPRGGPPKRVRRGR